MAEDENVTWDELKRARLRVQQQIETLQNPLRSRPSIQLIERLKGMLREIDEQLAQWKHP